MKRVYLSVINDLVADQRVHRVAETLFNEGADVMIIGRRLPGSQELSGRPYRTLRFRMLFRKGFFFYACYNTRLFFYLLFAKRGILGANDLDTLTANFLVSWIRRLPLVYDSHEYFTEVPELINRPFVRNFWLRLEKWIVPKVNFASTVSHGIAEEYNRMYNHHFVVLRNLPITVDRESKRPDQLMCGPKRIIIYQGSLNPGRGIDHMIRAMVHLDEFVFHIYGDGPMRSHFENLVREVKVIDRVDFMGRIPFDELKKITRQASIGISLEENLGKNYYYSLPNKLFDYIHAQVPVIVSDLPEMRNIVETYAIGRVTASNDPEVMAATVKEMMNDHSTRSNWKRNLKKAAKELCWENEKGKLLNLYHTAGLSFQYED